MATYNFPTLNISSALSAKAASVDSSTPALQLNLLTRTSENFNFLSIYDSDGALPLQDSAANGSLFLVKGNTSFAKTSINYFSPRGNTDNIDLTDPTDIAFFQGKNYGFFTGGPNEPVSTGSQRVDRFNFSSSVTVTDMGEHASGPYFVGQTSGGISDIIGAKGFITGGRRTPPVFPGFSNNLTKFSFVSVVPITSTASFSFPYGVAGQANVSDVRGSNGWALGGLTGPSTPAWTTVLTGIKFPYSSESTWANSTSLSESRWGSSGITDTVNSYGYVSGGNTNPTIVGTLDKFSLSSDFPQAVDLGNLNGATAAHQSGGSSSTYAYLVGGSSPPTQTKIQKFSFVNGIPVVVGDLGESGPITSVLYLIDNITPFPGSPGNHRYFSNACSEDHMYVFGGSHLGSSTLFQSDIIRFPFADETIHENVGNLTAISPAPSATPVPFGKGTGHQY